MTGEIRGCCRWVYQWPLHSTNHGSTPDTVMAAETLYTAIHDYLIDQLGSAVAEAEFARKAIRIEYSNWTDARLVAAEARLACIRMLLSNIKEAYDNVPIPTNWRSLVDQDQRQRRKKTERKTKIKGILRRTRGES